MYLRYLHRHHSEAGLNSESRDRDVKPRQSRKLRPAFTVLVYTVQMLVVLAPSEDGHFWSNVVIDAY